MLERSILLIGLSLIFSGTATAVTPRDRIDHKPGDSRNYSPALTALTQEDLLSQVSQTLSSPQFIDAGVADIEFFESGSLSNKADYLDFLDKKANLIIAQMPPEIQNSLHYAFYYNHGLASDSLSRTSSRNHELNFGRIQIDSSANGFKMTWPSYLNQTPVLDRVLKIDQVLIRLGLHLATAAKASKPMERFHLYANQKHKNEILYFAYSSYFYSRLKEILSSDVIESELQVLKEEAPKADYDAILNYLLIQTRPVKSLEARTLLTLIDFVKAQRSTKEVSPIDNFIEEIVKRIDQRGLESEMFLEPKVMLEARVQSIETLLKEELNQLEFESSKTLFLQTKKEAAVATGDSITLAALNDLTERTSDPCAEVLKISPINRQ